MTQRHLAVSPGWLSRTPPIAGLQNIRARACVTGLRSTTSQATASTDRFAQQTAVDWARQASVRCYRTGPAVRLVLVRGFLVHLKAFEPETEIPPPGLVAEPRRPRAHLYSPEQVIRMMEADDLVLGARFLPAEDLSYGRRTARQHRDAGRGSIATDAGTSPSRSRPAVPGDPRHQVPQVPPRAASSHHRRQVAGVSSGAEAARSTRRAATTLFINDHGRPLRYNRVRKAFLQAQTCAGIVKEEGRQGPALHALRHSFAVGRLLAWYRAGDNVRAQLPNLSVYLGHLGMVETYRYLSATPELLTIAGEMFGRYAEAGGQA